MKYLFPFIALIFVFSFSFAQDVVIEEDIDELSYNEESGPNSKHFSHFYLGLNTYNNLTGEDNFFIKPFISHYIKFGFRDKYKLSNIFALGYDVYFKRNAFYIDQDLENKYFPTSIIHEKERYILNNLGLSPYLRINFDPGRGNFMGTFLDLGAYADFTFLPKHVAILDSDNLTYPNLVNSKVSKLINRAPEFTERFYYGVTARFGFSRYVITADYRLSALIDKDEIGDDFESELPVISLGFQIGLHK